MLSGQDLDAIEQVVLRQVQAKFGLRAPTLARAMRRIGRRLPRDAHRAAAVLSTAKSQAGHPKLALMIDATSVETAQGVLLDRLAKIDPKERRMNMILSMLGTQAFNVLAVAALVIGVLMWRGFL